MEKKPVKNVNPKKEKQSVKKEKTKEKQSVKKVKEKKPKKKGITLVHERESKMDTFYDKKVQTLVKKLKDQDKSMDNNLRFGWKD